MCMLVDKITLLAVVSSTSRKVGTGHGNMQAIPHIVIMTFGDINQRGRNTNSHILLEIQK